MVDRPVQVTTIQSREGSNENDIDSLTHAQAQTTNKLTIGAGNTNATTSAVPTMEATDASNRNLVPEDGTSDIQGHIVTNPADLPEGKKKKRKNKTKTAGQRGIGKPTGMEEFFADSPMTPEQYEETRARYDPKISFVDRLTTAIQGFEFTRKLTNERRDIFYKWLHFGSIIVGNNVGSGGAQDTEDMDKDQINSSKSRVAIPKALREDLETAGTENAKYTVDFLGCMKGFLSRRVPTIYALDTRESVNLITTTLERFMDYLLQHEVCPEYQQDILRTRNFCREASLEMWSCAEALKWLPGDFNIACSTLFGGSYSRNYDGESSWADSDKQEVKFVGQKPQEAAEIFGFAIAGAATEQIYETYRQLTDNATNFEALEVVKIIKDHGFEIVDLYNPTADCKDMYKENSDIYRPVGRVIAVPWADPLTPPEDLTPEEQNEAKARQGQKQQERYEFFVEEIILRNLSVGQKIMATIQQLNCGVWFFDEFTQILPDFETFLINELMEDYKEPRWLPGSYAPGVPGWKEEMEDDEPEF